MLILLRLAGCWPAVWALMGRLSLAEDDIWHGRKLKQRYFALKAQTVFTSYNSPSVHLKRYRNRGRLLFLNDENLDPRSSLEYRFEGFSHNQGVLVVQHDNTLVPLRLSLESGYLPNFPWCCDSCSGNLGTFIILSNGPPPQEGDEEVVFELRGRHYNTGALSILGTKTHRVGVAIVVLPKGKLRASLPAAMLNNNAVIYLKNAVFRQDADFDAMEGCVALGDGAVFVANANFSTKSQVFIFLPEHGEAVLRIRVMETSKDAHYSLASLPSGSRIEFDADFGTMSTTSSTVKLQSTAGKMSVTIHLRYGGMSTRNFRYEKRVLTYDGDGRNRDTDPLYCFYVHDRIKEALKYEIEV